MARFVIKDLNDSFDPVEVNTFNDAVTKAIDLADRFKSGSEILEIKGKRKYFICGITEYPHIRFVR